MKPALSKNPVLVIDRLGLIGEPLSFKLSREFVVVFVSQSPSADVSFVGKFPAIPDKKYSHIIFIDAEGQDLELLPKVIDKVKNANSDFIFAQELFPKGDYAAERILKLYPSAKAVIFGDIFDKKLILRKENFKSVINKFIYQAQRFGKMQVPGEGLRNTYPVFLDDVVDGLIELVFKMHKSHSLFYIFPKHGVSELSLAHMLQKINPEVTVDFVKHDPRLENVAYPSGGKNLLEDKYPLAKKIRSIDIKKKVEIQNEGLNGTKKRLKGFHFFIFWVLIFLLFSPLIFTIFFSFLGNNTFYYAKREIDKGNFVNAKSSLHLSQTFFYLGKQASNILFFQAKIVGLENNSRGLSQGLDAGYKISQASLQTFNSGIYFSKIISGKSQNPIEDLTRGESYLKSSIITWEKLKAEGKIFAPISQNLENINPLIKLLSVTSDLMPSILGMDGPKTYLILFQDNMELRPEGGLINSYGILKFNLGKITQFSMHDIADADSQLRGHVEPPFALRRYLSEKHWNMKNSNFDIDFTQSALSSANFLLAETGEKADGVIAVNSSFSNILNKEESYLLIAQAISNALLKKDLLLEYPDAQNIFTVNGWSSSLWDERADTKEKINDFLGVSEANLGLNRVNGFIQRQFTQTVKIEADGSLFEELNLNYKNTVGNFLPNGNYKNYLRIILPLGTLLNSLSISDVSQTIVDAVLAPETYEAKNFKAPKGLEVEKTIEAQKTVYGFLVNVPAGETVKIKIQYTVLRKNVFNPDNFSYNLKIFKQPGVDILPYSFSLYYPDNLNIINAGGLRKEDNLLSFSDEIAGDKNLIASFAKK